MNPSTRYSIVSRQTKAEGRHGKEPITKGHSSAASASCSLKAAEQLPGLHGDALVFLDEVHIAATMSSEAVLPSDWTAHTVQRAAPSDCSALQLVLVNAMQPCRWQYEHLAIEIRDDMCTPGCD